MAIDPSPRAAAGQPHAPQAAPVERALFDLAKPLMRSVNGAQVAIHGIGMRALDTPDLPLLDRFHGQPIALVQNIVAALCDITMEQVRQLDIADFTMLASDAVFQVEQLSTAMGLPPRFFLAPRDEEEAE